MHLVWGSHNVKSRKCKIVLKNFLRVKVGDEKRNWKNGYENIKRGVELTRKLLRIPFTPSLPPLAPVERK